MTDPIWERAKHNIDEERRNFEGLKEHALEVLASARATETQQALESIVKTLSAHLGYLDVKEVELAIAMKEDRAHRADQEPSE